MDQTPLVFLSYSHDSDEHKEWVRSMAEDLLRGGVNVVLDQWDLPLGGDVLHFMEQGIAESDKTVCVCSTDYVDKANTRTGGVGYEGTIITSELAERLGTTKFVPLIRQPAGGALRPHFLMSRKYIDFSDDGKYGASLEALLRAIHKVPLHPKPGLGENPFVKSDRGVAGSQLTGNAELSGSGSDVAGATLDFLEYGASRFSAVVAERGASLPDHGSWEVACLLDGPCGAQSVNTQYLRLLRATNPRYTGWPLWVVLSDGVDPNARPYVFEGGWEALEISIGHFFLDTLDFWRAEPGGRFYHRRAFEDDLTDNPGAPKPLTGLDLVLTTKRVTESMGVVLAFAEGMGCDAPNTSLHFCFRWQRLKGRLASSWADPNRPMLAEFRAYQDSVITQVTVGADTPEHDIHPFVSAAVTPLFSVFDGLEMDSEILKGVVQEVLARGR